MRGIGLILLVSVVSVLWVNPVSASDLLGSVYEEVYEEYWDRVDDKRDVERIIDEMEEGMDEVEKEIENIGRQIDRAEKEIDEKEWEIVRSEEEMDRLLGDIVETEAELADREEDFVKRIRSTNRSGIGIGDLFTAIVTAGSFSDMVDGLNKVRKVLRSDNDVISEYMVIEETLMEQREKEKELLDLLRSKREELRTMRGDLESGVRSAREERILLEEDYGYMVKEYEKRAGLVRELEDVYYDLRRVKESKELDLTHRVGEYQLNPLVEYLRLELIEKAADRGIRIETTEGYRSFLRQDYLYGIGRGDGDERSVVTNARGGQSFHNFGLAFDIVIVDQWGNYQWDGNVDTNGSGKSDWEEVGEIGKSLGLDWGGDFEKILDMPHYEYTFGNSLSDLRRLR